MYDYHQGLGVYGIPCSGRRGLFQAGMCIALLFDLPVVFNVDQVRVAFEASL
jgi:hypothetical protein